VVDEEIVLYIHAVTQCSATVWLNYRAEEAEEA
jgi:hypothetical protein